MKVDIFFDTNILYYDYKIKNRKLKDLVEWLKEGRIEYRLCLTEMSYHELLAHFDNNTKSAIKEIEDFNNHFLSKYSALYKNFSSLKPTIYDTEQLSGELTHLKKEYDEILRENFEVIIPSANAHKKVFDRYYEGLSPFKKGMKEFKDALIWETISEHSELHDTPTQIWFISSDKSAFYNENADALDEDFKHDGYIYFYKDLKNLLEEKEIIINDLLPDYIEEIFAEFINNMNKKTKDYYVLEESITMYLENYISTNYFDGEYGDQGWGTDLYIDTIEISELHFDGGYRSLSHIYLPANITVDFEFNIETINTVYEKGDTNFEQNISIGEMSKTADLYLVLTYDLESKAVVEIGDIEFH